MEFSQFVMRLPLRTHPHNYCVLFSNFICISSSKFHDKRWKNQTCCVKYMKLNWIIYGIIGRPMKGPDRLYTWTHMDGMHNILIAIVIFDFIMSKTFACKLCVCVCVWTSIWLNFFGPIEIGPCFIRMFSKRFHGAHTFTNWCSN